MTGQAGIITLIHTWSNFTKLCCVY